ncbi:MAG: Bax inhibitor-1/YccA family protein [Gammaproteobacteria bacterium]|nr:Bax inhibitor-1/YccA family protein [Gammaproteobacteria bacterium]MCG3144315.1 Modulator of FtsH protease YccA [Gammaproteobacteria bacterium]
MATPYRATGQVIAAPAPSVLSTNRVLRNTYLLLALTLGFSAVTAGVAVSTNMTSLGLLPTLIGYFGLLFLTQYLRNSAWGLLAVFALTGFMGLTLGPLLNAYMGAFANGPQLVATALGGTAAVFVGLSAYALTTRRDFSFMGGMLFAGILVAFLAGLAAYFLEMPGLSLAVSALFVMLMAGLILFETSAIVHGGETNYIMATVSLYVAIYNIFTSLLHLFGIFGGDE